MQMEPQTGGRRTPESVPLEQVLRIAELAQLELRLDEQQEMLRDLNAILGHVAQLNQLDTTNVPPMTQVKEALGADSEDRSAGSNPENRDTSFSRANVLREDQPRPSLDRSQALAAAPETDGAYFKVPKVIER